MALLARLADEPEEGKAFTAAFVFNTTTYWTALTHSRAADVGEERQRDRFAPRRQELAVAVNYRAAGTERDQLLDRALLDYLVLREPGGQPERRELRLAAQRLARQNGLADGEALQAWRRSERLSDAEWHALLDLEARRERLRAAAAARLDPLLLLALKREGRFAAAAGAVERAAAAAAAAGLDGFSLEDWGLAPGTVEAWYAERLGAMRPDPENHARALGFATLREFLAEVVKALVAERGAGPDEDGSGQPAIRIESLRS
jgi:hypothetical protein